MSWLLWLTVWPLLALAVGYAVGVQYERGGAWRVLVPVVVVALVLDVVLNWTLLSLLMLEWPRWKAGGVKPEWTFSDRLERLVTEAGWRSRIAQRISTVLNYIAPNKRHIKTWPNPPLRQASA